MVFVFYTKKFCVLCAKQQSEGTIGETNPYLQKLAFVAQMTAFAGYLVDLEKGEKMAVSREEAKRFVYEALVKSLN